MLIGKEDILSPRFDRRFASYSPPASSGRDESIAHFRTEMDMGEFRFAPTACPCGNNASVTIATVDRYLLPLTTVVCDTCGTLRFDPYLTQSSVDTFYATRYQELYRRSADLPAYFQRQAAYGQKILRSLASPRGAPVVVEIGCGAGGALSVFENAGWQCFGCEPDARLAHFAQSRGLVHVRSESLAETAARMPPQSCDLIFSHHVFEHILQPVEQLQLAREMLKDDGVILHIIPDVLGIHSSRYPAGDLMQYLHIAHIFNYTFRGLELLAARLGLVVNRLYPARLATAWSHSAEMWVALSKHTPNDIAPCSQHTGQYVRDYLHRVEHHFCYGIDISLPQALRSRVARLLTERLSS